MPKRRRAASPDALRREKRALYVKWSKQLRDAGGVAQEEPVLNAKDTRG